MITHRTPYGSKHLEMERMKEKTYECFEDKVTVSLNSISDVKQRTLRANDKPWVTKEMRKEIMHRSRLENRKFVYGREEDFVAFKRQQNYCNRLYHRARKNYYNNLDVKNVTDNV